MTVRFHLDNGMPVVFEEHHASKVVAFQVWVQVGSADERPEDAGLAHLHEHMLFKGTDRRGTGEIAKEIEAHGGEINAWTSFDHTVYHAVLASSYARIGLDVLSDAIRHSKFDALELAREIEVVCEEIKRSDDLPARRASRDLYATAFTVHPYQRPVIGWERTVRAFTRDHVLDFYRRHYSPKNMVLSVAGDIDEGALRRMLKDTLEGDWGRPFVPVDARPGEPAPSRRRFFLKEEDVKEVHVHLAFHIPSVTDPDAPALDALAALLGQGEASRLVLEIKRNRALVNDIRAFAYTPKDPGLFSVSLFARPELAPLALEKTVLALAPLRTAAVSDDELAAVKALIEADAIYQRETVQGQARRLGFYEAGAGGIEREAEYYRRISQLTPQDIQRTAERYLRFDCAVLTGLFPVGSALSIAQAEELLDRATSGSALPPTSSPRRPPPPGRPSLTLPRRESGPLLVEALPCGGQLVVWEDHSTELLAIRAAFLGGTRYENEHTAGLNALLARMLTRGTPSRSAEEISQQVEQFSGSMGGQAGRNSLSLRGEFLSKHFERAFAVFADCLVHANHPETEFMRERALQIQGIITREENPSGLALDLFAGALFQRHPYRFPTSGEKSSVEHQTPQNLRDYQSHYLNPSQMTLSVVGDIEANRIIALARDAFAQSMGGTAPPPLVPQETPSEGPRRNHKVLKLAQSHVVLGFMGIRMTDLHKFPLQVLSCVLAGQGGRLFLELRDKRSLAYSVSSFCVEGLDPGFFATYVGTSPEKVKTALEALHAELARIRDERIPEAELARAKRNLIGAHEIDLQLNSARAALLALDYCYGIGAENFSHYAEKISAVTAEHVREAAERVINFERSALAIVGP